MIYNMRAARIYFGAASDQFVPSRYKQLSDHPGALHPPFAPVCKTLQINRPIFLHQVHGTDGIIISTENQAQQLFPFSHEGDYLITNLPGVGIGVITADCLPVMLYDKQHNVVAAVHAGWRGAVSGIVPQVVNQMQKIYGSHPERIKAIFGPGARGCCYEVQKSFQENLEPFSFGFGAVRDHGGRLFFDLPEFVRAQLMQVGVLSHQIDMSACECTICHDLYYSHRRGDKGRNMSVIVTGAHVV